MSFFAGLDVSLEETSVCIVDNEGKVLRESKVETDPAALREALAEHAGELGRIGVEASSIGIWVHRELQAFGLPMVVVETRHMRSSLSAMRNKTDRNDARGIASMMRLGWFRPVHVKCLENQKLHTLLANRKLLKRKLIDIENNIRGSIRTYGLRMVHVGRKGFEARVRELMEGVDLVLETMISTMLDVRRNVLEGFNRLHEILLKIVMHDPICRRFMAVPGVGPIAALSFKVAVDDPHRFARSRTVGAHFGLTPRRHQSGTSVDFAGHISKQGDFNVRGALCEAATSLLTRVQRWSALKAWGMKIAKRSSMMCAIVAVARKLASILHSMWVNGTDFKWASGAKITAKMRVRPAH
jgi:transposase